mmetsp:Transcript_82778/g.165546  ORF Transcript_82778/g.165546 Transcript_82778/m.165546 type:complete len:566 (+) Transcript_82778:2-1699(+)
MRLLSTLALLARLAIVLVAGPTWVARSALVIELTADTFDMVVDGSTNVLVMFHAFDCGHCKAIEPEFEDVASVVRPQHDLVLAMVDCDTQRSIARRFEITGYPTFKWFEKGSIQADKFHLVHFGGRRMGDTFIKLITDDTRMPHLRLVVNKNKNLAGGETDGGDGLGEEAEAAAAQQMVGGALVLPPVVDHWSKVTHHTFPAFVASPTSPSRGEAEGVNVKGCGGSSGGALVYVHTPWNDRDDVKVSLRQVADAFLRASTSTKLSCLPRFGRMAMRTGAERDVLQAYGVKEFPAFLVFGEGNETEALATAGSQKDQERHGGGNEDSGMSGGGGGVGGERNEDKSAGKWSLLAASYGSDSLSDPHALVKLATSSLPSHSGTGESATDRNFVKVPARRTSSLTEFQNHHDDDDGKGFSVLSASTVATLPTTFLSATVGEYHRRFFERVQSDSEEDSAVGGGGGSSSDGDDDGGGGRGSKDGERASVGGFGGRNGFSGEEGLGGEPVGCGEPGDSGLACSLRCRACSCRCSTSGCCCSSGCFGCCFCSWLGAVNGGGDSSGGGCGGCV